MSERLPWTREELQALIPRLDRELAEFEAEEPTARPLGAMTKEECLDYFHRLTQLTATRPLTTAERFLMGQFLSVFEQAVRAEMLGKKGRYFVVDQDQLNELMAEQRKENRDQRGRGV